MEQTRIGRKVEKKQSMKIEIALEQKKGYL